MRQKTAAIHMMIAFLSLLIIPSCISDESLYGSATGEEGLPKWRLLARARERYGPYIRWKEDLITELVTGSSLITTEKGVIEYTLHGDSGPFLLIMHGAPGGYDQTQALFSDMLDKGFRVLSWSRPGYIRTPLTVGETYQGQADAAAALMDALHIEKAAVLGYSAGGPPSIIFAHRYPDRIRALILESAVTGKYVVNPDNTREKLFFGYLMYEDPVLWSSDVMSQHVPRLVGRSTVRMESTFDEQETRTLVDHIMNDPHRIEVVKSLTRSMSPSELREEGMENDLKQLAKIGDLHLERVAAPTLIIHGLDDADVPVSHARLAAKKIPGAELFLVPGGFHILALSDSIDRITEKRLAFLKHHAP